MEIVGLIFGFLQQLVRTMPPHLDFEWPTQGADYQNDPHLSWLHVPVSIRRPQIWQKKVIERAAVELLLDNGDAQSPILLRWRTRDGPKSEITLELGNVSSIPSQDRTRHPCSLDTACCCSFAYCITPQPPTNNTAPSVSMIRRFLMLIIQPFKYPPNPHLEVYQVL